jgi:hypothetical protein
MTEAEWLACTEPLLMLEHLRGREGPRKLRLFAVACCRRLWHLFSDWRCRRAVEVAERFADGEASEAELAAARAAIQSRRRESVSDLARRVAEEQPSTAAWFTYQTACRLSMVAQRQASKHWELTGAGSEADQQRLFRQMVEKSLSLLLRDLIGNPFHPVELDPAWLRWNNGCVVALAGANYERRDFGSMPILADALEEAGCDNQEVLDHCRLSVEHVRGCWVVDAVLDQH